MGYKLPFLTKWRVINAFTLIFLPVLVAVSQLQFLFKTANFSQNYEISIPSVTNLIPTASPTIATTVIYPIDAIGYAISWPQCNKPYPTLSYDFGIIGVTGGRSFTHNPCFKSEYEWASQAKYKPTFYINLDFLFLDNTLIQSFHCEARDQNCIAFHYGYETAKDAYSYASSQRASSHMWWLDVQIMSSWSKDKTINSQVILGAIDFFKTQNVKVGLSTTSYQWGEIAGDLQTGLPNWIPGMPKDKAVNIVPMVKVIQEAISNSSRILLMVLKKYILAENSA